MSLYQDSQLTCKPLDTYSEVWMFLQNPPPWRSLCKDLQPHSKYKLKNIEHNRHEGVIRTLLDGPESFCHYDPDADEPERHDEKSLPKTLVCHDMANGYHDDSEIDGTGNFDAYTFYNWAGIDIFCYFSHHLITIPPLGWINVGHEHGVKVIGTVITEWADGVEFWEDVLESEAEYKNFANALVVIAKTLKFDGWLLNIENKIAKPDVLLKFVKYLHTLLHQELKEPELIWYDSVTVEGHLNWQNALNHKNKAFFEACDGLFTNYSWAERDVAASAAAAGERLRDLYIGIDVWGRNFYGGGQFNCQEAVEIAHNHGCSLAIFAPAWTHEAITLDKSDLNFIALAEDFDVYDHFLLRDRALWDSLWRYLNTTLPSTLPFKTSFCRGQGIKRRLYGEVIGPVPWYNLRHMQYQPNAAHGPHGYLLSTIEHILHASRTGILMDPRGIIKYREEIPPKPLVALENDADKSNEDINIVPKADSLGELKEEKLIDEENKTAIENNQLTTDENQLHKVEDHPTAGRMKPTTEEKETATEEHRPKQTLKRKLKSCIKHIFQRTKARKEYKDDTGTDNHENNINIKEKNIEIKDQPALLQTRDSKVVPKLEVIPEQSSEPEIGPNKREASVQKQVSIKETIDEGGRMSEKEQMTEEFQSEDHRAEGMTEWQTKTPNLDLERRVSRSLTGDELKAKKLSLDDDTSLLITGRSMVQMSVNIQLKDKDAKTRYGLAYVPDELECLEVYYDDSFIGGSCLKINPADEYSSDHRQIRLFHCDFQCEHSLIVCVVTKNLVGYEEQFLNVKLHMTDESGERLQVILIGRDVSQLGSGRGSGVISHVAPVNTAAGEDFRDVQKYMLLHQPGFYVPVENSYNWHVRYYEVVMPRSRVTSVNCNTGLVNSPILLGHFAVCHRSALSLLK